MKFLSTTGKRASRALALVLSLMLLLTMTAVPAFAADSAAATAVTDPSLFAYYDNNDGTVEITGYNGDDKDTMTELDIPAEIDGKSVTSIGVWAFNDWTSLERVTIPEGITSIGIFAFADCTSLTNVTIPDSVISIEGSAFFGCTSLKSVTIPEGMTKIGYTAFYDCPNLKSVTIPKSVTSIGYYAFGCYYIEKTGEGIRVDGFKITGYKNSAAYAYARDNGFEFESLGEVSPFAYNELENGTLEIVGYYGDDRDTMTDIVIPAEIDGKSITSIGDSAFNNCKSLESVTIPNNVTIIESFAFSDCKNLAYVSLSDGLTEIGDYAFKNCPNIKEITIPNSVFLIGSYALGFYGEKEGALKVDNFIITGYKNSAAYAYARDNGFKFVSLGEVDNAFAYREVEDGTLEIFDYYGDKAELTKLYIPAEIDGKKVTSIGLWAFDDCINLKSVTIPKSITSIEYNAFGYYYDMETYDTKKVDGFTITGYAGTAAEDYANENGFEFIALEEKKSGDIDGSGAVDAKDRMTITRYIAKWKGYESIDKTAADVNSDGEVDAADRMIITRHIAKWKGYEALPYTA